MECRRELFPLKNWDEFLEESKREFEQRYSLKRESIYNRGNFELIRTIGEGIFSRIILARLVSNKKYYALKVMDKIRIHKERHTGHIINEKRILQAMNFPFCLPLETAFKDNSYVYLCFPFFQGGEIFNLLKKMGKFDEHLTKFYGAQVLLAFEYLHYCDLVYRYLKPESIIIDRNGYLKLADFSFCKIVKTRTYTLCGTPDYIAPEILVQKGYGQSADWWSYGVLLYEMASGFAPFYSKEPLKLYEKVLNGKFKMPSSFSKSLADLIENLLQVDVTKRLGCIKNGASRIKEHIWFSNIDFSTIVNRTMPSPITPDVKDDDDDGNYEFFREERLEVAQQNYLEEEFADF